MHSRTLRSAGLCDVSVVASPAHVENCAIGIELEEELLELPRCRPRESAALLVVTLSRAEHFVRDGDEQLEEL